LQSNNNFKYKQNKKEFNMHFYSELTKNKKMRVSSKRGKSLQILNLKKLKNKIPIAGEP